MAGLVDQLAQAFKHGHKMGSTDILTPGDTTDTLSTKAEVNYRNADPSSTDSCGGCLHFDGKSKCDIVAGKISESMVCDKFEPTDTAAPDSQSATSIPTGP